MKSPHVGQENESRPDRDKFQWPRIVVIATVHDLTLGHFVAVYRRRASTSRALSFDRKCRLYKRHCWRLTEVEALTSGVEQGAHPSLNALLVSIEMCLHLAETKRANKLIEFAVLANH